MTYIKENAKEIDDELIENIKQVNDEDFDEAIIFEREQNFRRYLKAKAMQFNVPIQIVRDQNTKTKQ